MSEVPISAAVAALWQQVGPSQLATARELEAAAERAAADPADAEAWRLVREHAHRIAGTLGSFGQAEAGALALELDDRVAGTTMPEPSLANDAYGLARRLRTRVEASLQV